ncbi:hypothetical protein R1sor_004555 [Riccia sorocarpa]|uniref:SNRNP25 ubiquitin-like domain-containing protein n=1 Tax=Riccia sorocarpa TaxID=122646 RepID=A0ABD3HNG0_9MARC
MLMLNHLRKSVSANYYQRLIPLDPALEIVFEDPVSSDVPKRATVADINKRIGVQHGSIMKLFILRMDNTTFDVMISNTATVRDLKAAIQKKVAYMEERQLVRRQISWQHVWENFCLTYNHEKLLNDDAMLREYSMKDDDQLQFTPHVASRESGKYSRTKKLRFFGGLRKSISPHGKSTVGR